MNSLVWHIPALLRNGFYAVIAAAIFSAAMVRPAAAYDVVVAVSEDLKPYQDAISGVRDACGCEARAIKIVDDEGLRKVLRQSPDAVVAVGTVMFNKIRSIKNLPVIYVMAAPWATDDSLTPNISGVNMETAPEAYITTLREVFPRAKKIGLLYNPRHFAAFVAKTAKAARAAGLDLAERQVREAREIPQALQTLKNDMDVFWMLPDPTVVTPEMVDYLLNFSFQHNVPIFTFSRKYLALGAVAALDVDPYEMGVQAGEIIKALAAGRTRARRVYAGEGRLTINRRMAEKMGLRLSPDKLKGVEYVE